MSNKSPFRSRKENVIPSGVDPAELEFFASKPKLARTPLKSMTNSVPTLSPAKPPMTFKMSSSKPSTPVSKAKPVLMVGSDKKEKRVGLGATSATVASTSARSPAAVRNQQAQARQQAALSSAKTTARKTISTPTKIAPPSNTAAPKSKTASTKTPSAEVPVPAATAAPVAPIEDATAKPIAATAVSKNAEKKAKVAIVTETAPDVTAAVAVPAAAPTPKDSTPHAASEPATDAITDEVAEEQEQEDARTITFIEQLLQRKLKPDEFRKLAREMRSPGSRRSSFAAMAAAARRRSSLGSGGAAAGAMDQDSMAMAAAMEEQLCSPPVTSASKSRRSSMSASPSCVEVIDELRCVLSAFIVPSTTTSASKSAASAITSPQPAQGGALKVSYKFKGFGAGSSAGEPQVVAQKGPKVTVSRAVSRKSIAAAAASVSASEKASSAAAVLSPMAESQPEENPFHARRALRRSPVPVQANRGTPNAAISARRNVMTSDAMSELQKKLSGATGAVTSINRRGGKAAFPAAAPAATGAATCTHSDEDSGSMQVEEALLASAMNSPVPAPCTLSPPPRSAARTTVEKSPVPAARRLTASGAIASAKRNGSISAAEESIYVKSPLVRRSPPAMSAASASAVATATAPNSERITRRVSNSAAKPAVPPMATSANEAALTQRLLFLEEKLSQSLECFDQYKTQSAAEIHELKQCKIDAEILVCKEHLEKLSAAQFMLEQKELLRVERRARMRAEVAIALLSTKLTESIEKISDMVATSSKQQQLHDDNEAALGAVVTADECTAAIMSMEDVDHDDELDPASAAAVELTNKSVSKSLIHEFETADTDGDNAFDTSCDHYNADPEPASSDVITAAIKKHHKKSTTSSYRYSSRTKVPLHDPLGLHYARAHNVKFIPMKSGVTKLKPYGDGWVEESTSNRGTHKIKKEKHTAQGENAATHADAAEMCEVESAPVAAPSLESALPVTVAERAAASVAAVTKGRGRGKKAATMPEPAVKELAPQPVASKPAPKDSKKRKKDQGPVSKPTVDASASSSIGFSPIAKSVAPANAVDEVNDTSSDEDEQARNYATRRAVKSLLKGKETKQPAASRKQKDSTADSDIVDPATEEVPAPASIAPAKKMVKGKGKAVPAPAPVVSELPAEVTAPITMTLAQKLANVAEEDLFSPTRSPPKKKASNARAAKIKSKEPAPAVNKAAEPMVEPEEAPVVQKKSMKKGAAKTKQSSARNEVTPVEPVIPPAAPVPVTAPQRTSTSFTSNNSSIISTRSSIVSGMVPVLKPKGAMIIPKLKSRK